MADKTDGKVFWATKDSDRRLMISWQAKRGETKIPVPQAEAKIIPLMMKMKVDQADVKFDLVSGNPRNIEFVDSEAAVEAENEVNRLAKIQRQNAEKLEQITEPMREETAIAEKRIDTNYSKDFHNPYNFVPAIPRGSVTGELADREPSGHDRYIGDKLSGKLTVKMMVKTPLVVLDTSRVEMQDDHKKFPVRVSADGKPFINPTAVKGMLRSAYEAVTNSRMSVFTKHEDRLAFRPEAGQGAFVVPVRIEEESGVKKVVFYTGTNEMSDIEDDGSPKHGNPLCAAWLPRYFDKKVDRFAPKYSDGVLPKHKEEVKVYIEKFEHYKWKKRERILSRNPDFVFWRVRSVVRESENLGTKPNPMAEITREEAKRRKQSYYRPLGIVEEVSGIILISNHNMQSKHDEKVFFKNPNSPKSEILSDKKWSNLKKAWKELIENYRAEHEKVKGKLEPVPGNLRIGEWSRHIQLSEKEKDLQFNMLCFAEVEKDSGNNFVVKRLFPVMISRQLFDCSPLKLIENDSQGNNLGLTSATDINNLSPADRVFGCVIQNPIDKKKANANRGQVRFGSVVLSEEFANKPIAEIIHKFEGENELDKWLPINILGQPKPQQGRFYVAETENGEAQIHQWNNEDAGYKTGRGLRGRKVYPHHANLPDDYWFEEKHIDFRDENKLKSGNQFREYLRPPSDKQRNNQNRSIEGWIKPQTEFEFDIHFTNLSEIELGALIWLLQLPEKHFHRFGGGKPLGFGSVKLELSKYQINKGSELTEFYKSLDNELTEITKPDKNKEAFEKTVKDTFIKPFTDEIEKANYQNIIKSFLSACKGFADKPTHYPRKESKPNADGKSFEWFVANSHSKNGRKLALPNLSNEIGLPRNPQN